MILAMHHFTDSLWLSGQSPQVPRWVGPCCPSGLSSSPSGLSHESRQWRHLSVLRTYFFSTAVLYHAPRSELGPQVTFSAHSSLITICHYASNWWLVNSPLPPLPDSKPYGAGVTSLIHHHRPNIRHLVGTCSVQVDGMMDGEMTHLRQSLPGTSREAARGTERRGLCSQWVWM